MTDDAPVPPGFAAAAVTMTDGQMSAKFGWPFYKVRYWRRRLNLSGGWREGRCKFTEAVRDYISRWWYKYGPSELARILTESQEFPGSFSKSGVATVARKMGLPPKVQPRPSRLTAMTLESDTIRWRCHKGKLHEGGYGRCACS